MCCTGVKKTIEHVRQIGRAYNYLAQGVNEELMEERMKICNNCPHFVGGLVCQQCGCPMHAKARLPEVECADTQNKRWLAVA
jgi:hypothetical protein